jgi:uncharacterized protein
MPNQAFTLELKSVSESGEFSGLASVYNVEDLGGDLVEPGAFTKTLAASKARPLLWQHRDPIGTVQLVDTPKALELRGKLSLGVQQAKEAYVLLKDGAVEGISIGYESIRSDFIGGVRHLKEVRLWEVSLVTFPMLPSAQVTEIKSGEILQISSALNSLRGSVLEALKSR